MSAGSGDRESVMGAAYRRGLGCGRTGVVGLLGALVVVCASTSAAAQASFGRSKSLADTRLELPSAAQVADVLLLREYNTRVVVIGTMLLGLGAGVIGTFLLLRKRALMGDALSHATLPGIALAFIVMTRFGGSGKSLPGLLLGATIFGGIGVACVLLIRGATRLKEDTALGIVLSVFFGLGVSLLGVIQKMDTGSAAGLESFIYGKTASMLASDAKLIAVAAGLTVVGCVVFYKEFSLLCFDESFARSQGWPRLLLDGAMMAMVVMITVIGLGAVGLILMIALLVIPPAAARFWSHRLGPTVLISGGIGAVSGWVGASVSALAARLPAGAIIVLTAASAFVLSMIFGVRRGVLVRAVEQWRLRRSVERQHLLRAMYEAEESGAAAEGVGEDALLRARTWSRRALRGGLRRAQSAGEIEPCDAGRWRLTEAGRAAAARVVRNHRLWELYLVTHADIAPSHVDRDADELEHVLGAAMVEELELLLVRDESRAVVPASPHAL